MRSIYLTPFYVLRYSADCNLKDLASVNTVNGVRANKKYAWAFMRVTIFGACLLTTGRWGYNLLSIDVYATKNTFIISIYSTTLTL